jgi:hypothetical protein
MTGARKEHEISVAFEDVYWKLFRFKETPNNLYLIPLIPHVGLHLSMHFQRAKYLGVHLHVKSEKLGIEEDIGTMFFSEESLKRYTLEFLNCFRLRPLNDEQVIVLPPKFLEAFKHDTQNGKERTVLDLGSFVEGITRGTFYKTQARRLPLLFDTVLDEDFYGQGCVFGVTEKKMIIPINPSTMIELDHHRLFDQLKMTLFGDALGDAMSRAFDAVSNRTPNALKQWVPYNMFKDLERRLRSVRLKKPIVVAF